jgi:large exoprotein involved in heme utilization and adhesion
VSVAGALSIDGTASTIPTGITSQSEFSPGNAGEVRVTAGSLTLGNGGQISASTFGTGAGGDVQVTAGVLALSGGEISASTFADGAGGDVGVAGNSLSITRDGSISAATFAKGAGGNVSVAITGPISIDGTGQSFATGITSASGLGAGNAGEVTVTAGSLAIDNGGEVSASTRSKGTGGDILINLSGDLVIDGLGSPSTFEPAGIIARTLGSDGGNAGQITVNAGNVSILNSGVISTSTFGGGAAGEVSVNASGKLVLDGVGTPRFGANIASSANFGAGNAGRVTVNAGSLSLSHGGEIQSLTFVRAMAGMSPSPHKAGSSLTALKRRCRPVF